MKYSFLLAIAIALLFGACNRNSNELAALNITPASIEVPILFQGNKIATLILDHYASDSPKKDSMRLSIRNATTSSYSKLQLTLYTFTSSGLLLDINHPKLELAAIKIDPNQTVFIQNVINSALVSDPNLLFAVPTTIENTSGLESSLLSGTYSGYVILNEDTTTIAYKTANLLVAADGTLKLWIANEPKAALVDGQVLKQDTALINLVQNDDNGVIMSPMQLDTLSTARDTAGLILRRYHYVIKGNSLEFKLRSTDNTAAIKTIHTHLSK